MAGGTVTTAPDRGVTPGLSGDVVIVAPGIDFGGMPGVLGGDGGAPGADGFGAALGSPRGVRSVIGPELVDLLLTLDPLLLDPAHASLQAFLKVAER